MLKYRILTTLVLIPLVLWGIFSLAQPVFTLVSALVILLAAWEWAGLANWNRWWQRLLYVLFILAGLAGSVLLPPWVSFAVGFAWWTMVTVLIMWVERTGKIMQFPSWVTAIMGMLVLIPCWQALIVLHLRPKWLLLMLVMVWIIDSAAYFGGRWLGKNKLAPVVSPNKTLEGACTALMVTAVGVIGVTWYLYGPLPAPTVIHWMGLILATTMAAIVGDLFESLLKRQQGLKDSGHLLPGHGGILDRIDSLTAAAPIFFCSSLFFGFL